MQRHRLIVLFLVCIGTLHANADPHGAIHGTWGTQKQCEQEPIKAGGTRLAQPFTIDAQWLRHGQLW